MAFWDFWKTRPVGEDRTPPPAEPGAGVGAMRGGKKQGRWKERAETPFSEWSSKTMKYEPVDHGWTELDYVAGVKQGKYVEWWGNGARRRHGAYVEDKLDGEYAYFNRDGKQVQWGAYRAGELDGRWRVLRDDAETVMYEGEYLDAKRHGRWIEAYGDTRDEGVYVAGERDGEWVVRTKTGAIERGAYRAGKRQGAWTTATPSGAVIAEGAFVDDKRHGPWTLRRDDGSIRARGEYAEGQLAGEWSLLDCGGAELGRYRCADDEALQRWEDFHAAVELLAEYAPTEAWVERARRAFAALRGEWQVQAKTDAHGQHWLSAPLDAGWQLRVAAGVPVHEVCRDECWSKVMGVLEQLPADEARAPAELVAARCGSYPSNIGRDWLTRIVDDEHDDPRTRIVSRFEPGRELSRVQLERFAQRVPHLRALTLRECELPDGLAPLLERGFPELERLIIVRTETTEDAIDELVALLARAAWPTRLVQLAIVETTSSGIDDAALAALLANPALQALTTLTLDGVTLGPATAAVLPAVPLEYLDLRDSRLDASALAALARMPALEELELRRCALPDLTTREAQACGPAAKLRTLHLGGTLGVEKYASAGERSAYAVARRLAVMPALAGVEVLDLSDNDLDGLAARVLARSPHLARLRELDWTGNATDDDELDELRAALPSTKIATSTSRGNVIILGG